MMKKMTRKIRQSFTLVEIIVAMSIFALLMLMVMQIFGAMQNVWANTSAKTKTFQNARVIMDMITADLQSAYYDYDFDYVSSYDTSWCYQQEGFGISTGNSSLWFVAHRQKSVQAKNKTLVQTGYWMEPAAARDGVTLWCLKNAIISTVDDAKDFYTYNKEGKFDKDASLTSAYINEHAVVLDNNIVSLTIMPFYVVTENNAGTKTNKTYNYENLPDDFDELKKNDMLPSYVYIELIMLDDNPGVRAKYAEADADGKEELVRKFTRVIEIDRRQYYEVTEGAGS